MTVGTSSCSQISALAGHNSPLKASQDTFPVYPLESWLSLDPRKPFLRQEISL